MNRTEAAQLLTIAGGIDRFITVDEVNTTVWARVLHDIDYATAEAVLIEHLRTWEGRAQIVPSVIVAGAEQIRRELERKERRRANTQENIERLAEDIALTQDEFTAREKQLRQLGEAGGWAPKPRTWQDHLAYIEQQKHTYPTWYEAAETLNQQRLALT